MAESAPSISLPPYGCMCTCRPTDRKPRGFRESKSAALVTEGQKEEHKLRLESWVQIQLHDIRQTFPVAEPPRHL